VALSFNRWEEITLQPRTPPLDIVFWRASTGCMQKRCRLEQHSTTRFKGIGRGRSFASLGGRLCKHTRLMVAESSCLCSVSDYIHLLELLKNLWAVLAPAPKPVRAAADPFGEGPQLNAILPLSLLRSCRRKGNQSLVSVRKETVHSFWI
jgi:hypothetical protein